MRDKYAAFADDKSISRMVHQQVQSIYNEYKHQKERQEDREWVLREVLKRLSVRVIDNATPIIKQINDEIARLMK